MAGIYLSPESDSMYLDLTAGDRSPTRMHQLEEGVLLHLDDSGRLLAIEVFDLSQRGGLHVDNLDPRDDGPAPKALRQGDRVATSVPDEAQDRTMRHNDS
jgi:uncharacterized protein YuzE